VPDPGEARVISMEGLTRGHFSRSAGVRLSPTTVDG
jgi:hypothetical protein